MRAMNSKEKKLVTSIRQSLRYLKFKDSDGQNLSLYVEGRIKLACSKDKDLDYEVVSSKFEKISIVDPEILTKKKRSVSSQVWRMRKQGFPEDAILRHMNTHLPLKYEGEMLEELKGFAEQSIKPT